MKNNENYDVIVLGAGASGMMCASYINQHSSLRVAIVDGNDKICAKVKVSGGGKCNITNVDVQAKHYLGESDYINSVLNEFSKDDLLTFLDENGLKPVIRKNRYYFCKNSSDEIIDIFKKLSRKSHLFLGQKIISVEKIEDNFSVKTNKTVLKTRKVVVATGAKSFEILGASSIGLDIARTLSLKTKDFFPSLVGLTVQRDQFWMKELSGISTPVRIVVDNRIIEEDLLFAHKGISGPAVLSASLYWHKGLMSINFLPNLKIDKKILNSQKKISTQLALPKRFSQLFLESLGVDDKACNTLNSEELQKLTSINNYKFAPAGNFGFTKAEVCRGGVDVKELQIETLEARTINNIYFIGEVLEMTGELGGYNFQWAFSSAVTCARGILKSS